MKRIRLGIIGLLLIVSACDKAGTKDAAVDAEAVARSLVIVNTLAETLSVVDTAGGVHNNVQVTGAAPNAILHDPPYLYVVNSLSNSIEVVRDSDLAVVCEISVGKGKNPMHAALIRPRTLAVTGFLSQTLEIVDIETRRVVRSIDLAGIALPRDDPAIGGKSYPYGVAVNKGRIFVTLANLTDAHGGLTAAGPGVVAVFDADTYASLGTIVLAGADPVYAGAYANKVFVACAGHYSGDITKPQSSGFAGDGSIEQIDAEGLTLERSYALAAAPFSFAISEDGRLYASNAMGARIPRLNIASGALDYIDLEGSYISAVLVDHATIFALDFSTDRLYALDLSGKAQARYPVGDGPIAMVSLAAATVAGEGQILPRIEAWPAITSPGREVVFDASKSLVPDGACTFTWDFGDGDTGTGVTAAHTYQAVGRYPIALSISGGGNNAIAHDLVDVRPSSPFAVQVVSYTPAPGQFIADARYNQPQRALGPPRGGGPYQPDNTSVVSLGGLGGALVVEFDHVVTDHAASAGNPLGLDFIVFGNAQYDKAPQRFIEPGLVEISLDGTTWFRIQAPGGYRGTYPLPATITDDLDESGYYRLFGYADLSPVLALPSGSDPQEFCTLPATPPQPGRYQGKYGGDAFDIQWAMDPATGQPALTGFRFIRITTAVDGRHGPGLGEFSTEVDAIGDIELN